MPKRISIQISQDAADVLLARIPEIEYTWAFGEMTPAFTELKHAIQKRLSLPLTTVEACEE